MRVALISENASPLAESTHGAGAQAAYVAELSAALARSGHDVRVYTRRDDASAPAAVPLPDGVTVVHVTAGPPRPVPEDDMVPHTREFSQRLVDWWSGATGDGWRPDVAHAHSWTSGLAAVTAARRHNIPVAQTYHTLGTVPRRRPGEGDAGPSWRIGYERALGRAVDRVIGQCQDEVTELVRRGVPRARITLVPPGVDTVRFTPDGPAEPRYRRRRVLSVSGFVDHRECATVIEAVRLAPDAELVVIGGPPAGPSGSDRFADGLRRLAAHVGVADRIRVVGPVSRDDLPRWYRSADVVACAPEREPADRTALEAMACGVPVIGTTAGSLADIVFDGLTGDLVAPRDPHGLGLALRRLLGDDLRRFSYATAALDRARQAYSWKRAVTQLTAVYDAIAGTGATTATAGSAGAAEAAA